MVFVSVSISLNSFINLDIFESSIIVAPSLGAVSGSWCVSIKRPATPTARAALASTGANCLCPPELSP